MVALEPELVSPRPPVSVPPSSLHGMDVTDSDAVVVAFRAIVRHLLRHEKVGDDTLGTLFELVRRRENGELTDAQLRSAVRHLLDGGPVDVSDPQVVNDEFEAMVRKSYVFTEQPDRGRLIARFAANARRLKDGEITRAEFEAIMRDDRRGGADHA